MVAILFRAIDALKTFDIIFVMTQGGPANASETINILLFNQAFSYFNMGYAASMAVALFALVMGASLILIKVRGHVVVRGGGIAVAGCRRPASTGSRPSSCCRRSSSSTGWSRSR